MKVAIVHYWLVGMRGGEKVLESLIDIYPNAEIFTHIYIPSKISDKINNQKVKTTFINKIPFSSKIYKQLLPLMPLALKLLNLKRYDLIISNESGPTKGFRKGPNSVHICYCFTPMRYIWDMSSVYLGKMNFLSKLIAKISFFYLRKWDSKTSESPDRIFVISNFIKQRVKKFWDKDSLIIYPPINLDNYNINENIEDYYLILSQLVYYKRIDIAIDAFNENNKKLIIIGEGDELKILKNKANSNIEFLGWVNEDEKIKYLSKSKALIFPGIEDFGIVPIESMASGRPVIAFKSGGALDYLKDNINGVYFEKQNYKSLNKAISYFEDNINLFDSGKIKESVLRFDQKIFKNKFKESVNRSLIKSE